MRRPRLSSVRLALVSCLVALAPVAAHADDWPSFRGPDHTGVAQSSSPPIEWSEEKNVAWKVPLEGLGHASPVVRDDRIFLVTVEAEGEVTPAEETSGDRRERVAPTRTHRFAVSAHDLATGRRLWKTVVREAVPHESLHPTASQASASPVTDGRHVWAHFGSRGLHCLDRDGKLVWSRDLGTFHTRNEFGEGASPALAGDRILVNQDHEGDSFIAAFDKTTGEELWRRERDEPSSWTTPLVVRDGDRDIAIVSAAGAVRGYDIATGDEVWRASGLGPNVVPTPVAEDGVVWAMSGWREAHGMAIHYAGARGDVTGTDRILWSADQGLSYVPSAVLVDGRIHFFQRFTGILSCYELATGKACYDRQRIDDFENVYASPVAAGDRIYAFSRDGDAVVFRAGPEFEILARNELDDVFNATPAIVGDTLILRGDRNLYRIEETGGGDGAPTAR